LCVCQWFFFFVVVSTLVCYNYKGVINIAHDNLRGDCAGSRTRQLTTIAEYAKAQGLGVGIVTTSRVTHATPAGMYGHNPERDWEGAQDLPDSARTEGCSDFAAQLIDWSVGGASWDVVLGGGRSKFTAWARPDGRDLVGEFTARHGGGSHFVSTTSGLQAAVQNNVHPLLGLFNDDHMRYHVDCVAQGAACTEPTLSEMTAAAITLLERAYGARGYVLMVEGARIDMAHHENNAHRALTEGLELHKAGAGKARRFLRWLRGFLW
jgi:alkaline phosphatase